MRGKLFLNLFIIVFAIGMANPGNAQGSTAQVKSLFVFNFTRYIQWPQSTSNITIGVLGDDKELLAAFEQMAAKKSSASAKITVKQFSNPAEAGNYHMVYIPEAASGLLSKIGSPKSTLVITEKAGLAKRGSYINFVTEGGKMKFEINKKAIDNSGLKVSGQLLNLAIIV